MSAIILIALAYLFWTGSRYPELDEKAMMSGAIQLEDPLGFEAKYPLQAGMSTLERIFFSTLNWVNTNKKGMTFGILFAAALLTALGNLRRRSFGGGMRDSFLGLFLGAPLGVCVNCAAPIARGMYAGGLRAEATLSAMIASPTLNVIVLGMTFSLLPTYMAISKIAFSLFLILIAVPLICRLLPTEHLVAPPQSQTPTAWSAAELQGQDRNPGLMAALRQTMTDFATNLWFIIRLTVPLMLLAGLLGAVAGTLLPLERISELQFGLAALLFVAAIGVFLPVPIAFDVVVAGALVAAGLAPGFVMTLLFTLGSFSIYSFFIVAQAISLRAAWMLALSVTLLGALAGLGAQHYHQWQSDRALDLLLSGGALFVAPAHASDALPRTLSADAERITIAATPFAPRTPAGPQPFERLEAREVGITKPLEFTMRDMWPPFWEGRSLSTGDIDRDGDLDVVIASTETGLYIFDNDGTGGFNARPAPPPPLAEMPVFNAALTDLNRDGWPDLFVTTYLRGNYVLWNRNGTFDWSAMQQVANREDAILTLSLAMDDLDADGFLDVALGNWAAGWYRRVPGEESRNRVLLSAGTVLDGQTYVDLPGIPGETLSILFSDINQDGRADLLVGNDFEVPDYFYLSTDQEGLRAVTHQDGLIPHTTTTTMAVKTGDLFNDGSPEIYLAQIAGRSSGVSSTLKMQPLEQYCDAILNADDKAACTRNMEIKQWYKSGNNFDPTYASRCDALEGRYQAECKAMLIKDLAIQRRDASLCRLIPATQPIPAAYCRIHFSPTRAPSAEEGDAAIAQILRSNVLLEMKGQSYADTAKTHGLEIGGWSWDTKIGDLDNDGFLDVYVVNGTWVPNEVSPSNLFFHNDGKGGFTEASGPFGLEDYLMTAAATLFDMDNDGDLDVLTHTVNGPLAVFRNGAQTGNSLMIELDDLAGNRDGIGAQLRVSFDGGRQLTREVQSGGGFMSFDAPRVHFGLGAATSIDRLEILWRTGAPTVIDGPIDSGQLLRITRAAD